MSLPYSNLEPEGTAGEVVMAKSGMTRWQILGLWIGLGAIALFSFHCIGVLVFSVLGFSPGSNNWSLALVLFAFLSVAGFFTSLQSIQASQRLRPFYQAISATSSGAILGLFVGAQLTNQDTVWTVAGLVAGSGLLLWLALMGERSRVRFVRCFWGSAIALIGSLCAYAMTFVFSAWFWFAATTQHVGLAVVFAVATVVGLWGCRRSLKTVRYYLIRTKTL